MNMYAWSAFFAKIRHFSFFGLSWKPFDLLLDINQAKRGLQARIGRVRQRMFSRDLANIVCFLDRDEAAGMAPLPGGARFAGEGGIFIGPQSCLRQ